MVVLDNTDDPADEEIAPPEDGFLSEDVDPDEDEAEEVSQ